MMKIDWCRWGFHNWKVSGWIYNQDDYPIYRICKRCERVMKLQVDDDHHTSWKNTNDPYPNEKTGR